MKVLTLHQPYASLIASGLKTIETRGWNTKYRGPLAIHAAARRVPTYVHHDVNADLPAVLDSITMSRYWEWTEHPDDPRHGGAYRWVGPLGAVVATAQLVDVIPMVHAGEEGAVRTLDIDDNGSLWIVEPEGDDGLDFPRQDWREVTSQAPYGDFRPGRFAWLLENIQPVEKPVPFRGGQGLSREWAA